MSGRKAPSGRAGKKRSKRSKSATRKKANWELRLYVAGMTPSAMAALSNLEAICEEHLKGEFRLEVIDLLERPQLAAGDQIFALPTLVRKLPTPVKKIIGDLSDKERVLVGLNIKPSSTFRASAG